jgi:sugar (pentulose or hexulose) kinase
MDLLIGLEVGTSAVKGLLVSAQGDQRAAAGGNFLLLDRRDRRRAVSGGA